MMSTSNFEYLNRERFYDIKINMNAYKYVSEIMSMIRYRILIACLWYTFVKKKKKSRIAKILKTCKASIDRSNKARKLCVLRP